MTLVMKTFASATCSWIDPATGLPEVDETPVNAATVLRPSLVGSQGYRFCNFMEVWIQGDFSKKKIVGRGFTSASGIYRGPSFANIPSHAFMTETEVFEETDALRFTQVIGARTVSPEVLGSGGGIVAGVLIGGGIGSVVPVVGTALGAIAGGVVGMFGGEIVGHQVLGFPPIWSKIQIRMFKDGRMEAQLLQHSLFPSLTFYRQKLDVKGAPGASFERITNAGTSGPVYDATKQVQLPDWQKRGWGALQRASVPGPIGGNPWGISKGLTGGREVVPN